MINSKFNGLAIESSELLSNSSKGFIYYLIKNNEVVYIGQTVSLEPRIAKHKRDKDFDEVRFVGVSAAVSLNDAEFSQIITHKPALNITLPEVSYLVSAAHVTRVIAKENKLDEEVGTGYSLGNPDISIDLNGNVRSYWVNRRLHNYELLKYEIIDSVNNLINKGGNQSLRVIRDGSTIAGFSLINKDE